MSAGNANSASPASLSLRRRWFFARPLSRIQAGEARPVANAALTLFLVMMAHALVETSRDALFLTHLPATHLPWVYLMLAVLALLSSHAAGRGGEPESIWRGLVINQCIAGVGTLAFLVLLRAPRQWMFYGLYIWGGLASTLILIRFWMLFDDRLNANQAKRLFPLIAVGPVAGALAGFGLAGLVARRYGPHALLAVSSGLFFAAAGASLGLRHAFVAGTAPDVGPPASPTRPRRRVQRRGGDHALRTGFSVLFRDPYVSRVTMVMLAASVAATLSDYAFKTVVEREVPASHLSSVLANSYFVFNLLSVGALLVVAPIIRVLGVPTALALQPALLAAGGIVWAVVGGLPAVLYLRGVDGALRWSLHKTATELLYVPMSARLRSAVKAASDVLAHRGGQALASVAILGFVLLGLPDWAVGAAVVVCAAAWIAAATSLRGPYLDLFRQTLSAEFVETRLEFPELDIASLETLVAALSSTNDHQVMAAIDLLHDTGRGRLLPALILYHPSAPVVVRALEHLDRSGRDDHLPIAARLLAYASPAVQAAVIRSQAAARPQRDVLERMQRAPSAPVAATAIVALAAHDWLDSRTAAEELERLMAAENEVALYVAMALRAHPWPPLLSLLMPLAAAEDVRTRREAIGALGALHDPRALPALIAALGDREIREDARTALLAAGDPCFAALESALADLRLPPAVRVHLPRTISRLGHQRAADLLLRQLLAEPRGMVRFKILRGLGRMVATHPDLTLDDAVLDRVISQSLTHLLEHAHWSILLAQGAAEEPARRTVGHELLAELIHDKQVLALERLFRKLGLRYRDEDVAQIYRGLLSEDADLRSSSRELLEMLLPPPLRAVVVALTDDQPEGARLAAGARFYTPPPLSYDELITLLTTQPSQSVADLASNHAAELGLPGGREWSRVGSAHGLPLRHHPESAPRLQSSAWRATA